MRAAHRSATYAASGGSRKRHFYRWKKAYGGLEPDQMRELKPLHEENERFKEAGGKVEPGQGNVTGHQPSKGVSAAHRSKPPVLARRRNEAWAMDVVADRLHGGCLRSWTCIHARVWQPHPLSGWVRARSLRYWNRSSVVEVLRNGCTVTRGSEFASRLTDLWVWQHPVTLRFSRPGRPTDNAYIESFTRSFRDECLNLHGFLSWQEAQEKIEAWRQAYHERRPHKALNHLSPSQYAGLKAASPTRFAIGVVLKTGDLHL